MVMHGVRLAVWVVLVDGQDFYVYCWAFGKYITIIRFYADETLLRSKHLWVFQVPLTSGIFIMGAFEYLRKLFLLFSILIASKAVEIIIGLFRNTRTQKWKYLRKQSICNLQ